MTQVRLGKTEIVTNKNGFGALPIQRISFEEAEKLIDELLTLDNPYHCPHGRPTIIAMTRTELEKKFKRIV